MKLLITIMTMATLLVFTSGADAALSSGDDVSGSQQQGSPMSSDTQSAADKDENLQKVKDRSITEGMDLRGQGCITGRCWKDAFEDACGDIGESCIHPLGSSMVDTGAPAQTDK